LFTPSRRLTGRDVERRRPDPQRRRAAAQAGLAVAAPPERVDDTCRRRPRLAEHVRPDRDRHRIPEPVAPLRRVRAASRNDECTAVRNVAEHGVVRKAFGGGRDPVGQVDEVATSCRIRPAGKGQALERPLPAGADVHVARAVARVPARRRRADDRVAERDVLARQREQRRHVRRGHVRIFVGARSTTCPAREQRDRDDPAGGACDEA
jgi:hypothetical protein